MDVQSLLVEASRKTLNLRATVQSLVAIIPVYGHKDGQHLKEAAGFGANYLVEVSQLPAWLLTTGKLQVHNDAEIGGQIFGDPPGHT